MKVVSVKLAEEELKGLDRLVEGGLFPSRSEALRAAVRELVRARRLKWPPSARERR
jgi:Arc/MetJ-type ribon-helix-helix transcriptional regulator